MTTATIPEGYYKDSQGRLVPESLVKEEDKARDEFVREIIGKAKQLQQSMLEFRDQALADIDAFVELALERYEAKLGGRKGNLQLTSYDGSYQIKRQIAERIVFGEELQAAKSLIDECLNEWTEGSRDEIRAIINDAFRSDKEGNLETGRILGLRRLNIQDDRWQRAMQAIGDAIRVSGTKVLLRFYERRPGDDKLQAITLDMASL